MKNLGLKIKIGVLFSICDSLEMTLEIYKRLTKLFEKERRKGKMT